MHTRSGASLLGTLRPGKTAVPSPRPTGMALPPPIAAVRNDKGRRLQAGKPALPPIADEMQPLMRHAVSAINAGMAILLQGETGAGKEIFARHLHIQSQWQEGPFVAINCGALPASLIDSEL